MNATISISNLRDRPEFTASVADRIWRAWWEPHGVPLDYIAARVAETVAAARMPRAFVAHDGDVFAGTASVIASDLDERPQYTPWVAAVWIEPQYRSQRLGRRLIAHAADHAFSLGVPRVFLTARPARRSLYESLGWDVVEEGVGHLELTIFKRDAEAGG
ncbi:MAG TPA: GNAT family N-acetyltransferase [Nitrobacter sp.]|jgi:GNAT superfamily N-acetyltransferase|nr:GNAT family N-acetyltransferase [Nitrobacter sp.]